MTFEIFLPTTFLSCCFNVGFAQNIDSFAVITPGQNSEYLADRMSRELSLEEEQKIKILKLMKERLKKIENRRSEKGFSIQSINEELIKKLKGILTGDQFATYKSLRENTSNQKSKFLEKNPDYVFSLEDLDLDI